MILLSASPRNKIILRRRLEIDKSAQQLANFLNASVGLMKVMARACGHHHLNQFCKDDLTTWKRECRTSLVFTTVDLVKLQIVSFFFQNH